MIYQMAKLKCRIIAEREATTELMRRLPGLMENAGLTKTDLIEITGINQPTIYALYAGTYESSLLTDNAAAIAQALGVTLTELTGL